MRVASVLGGALALVLLALVWLQWLRGDTPALPGDKAVAEVEPVLLGGRPQWILTRGVDRERPVLLFLHGEHGWPSMPLAHRFPPELERHYVVVHWDRLGAGKSWSASVAPKDMSVARELEDLDDLVDLLRERFQQSRIVLLGHDHGSYLGVLYAARYPEKIAAYVGVAQVADRARALEAQNRYLAEHARRRGNAELARRIDEGLTFDRRHWLWEYGGVLQGASDRAPLLRQAVRAPEYRLSDFLSAERGARFTEHYLRYDVISEPLDRVVRRLEVPVWFLLGRQDWMSPSTLAAEYFEQLQAPGKTLVWFEDSAHYPFIEQPRKFAEVLDAIAEGEPGLARR